LDWVQFLVKKFGLDWVKSFVRFIVFPKMEAPSSIVFSVVETHFWFLSQLAVGLKLFNIVVLTTF